MVIDTSAIVALLQVEPEAPLFLAKLASASLCRLSAATFVEAGIVARRDQTGARSRAFEELLDTFGVQIDPVTARQGRLALDAYARYGKGTGHPAGLNYGDCFSYALASDTGEPLLFKGEDFGHTDIVSAC